MNTLKTWFPIVSTGLAVFFMVLWLTGSCDRPITKPSDNELWRQKVASLTATIDEKDSIISAISIQRDIDTREHLRASNALQMREKALVRKLKAANADIQVIADSLPKVARYVELADSTIAVKDSIYNAEVRHGIATEQLYKSEIAALADKNVVQVKISDELMRTVTALETDKYKLARKLERKKRGNRLMGSVALGLGAAIAVMTLTN